MIQDIYPHVYRNEYSPAQAGPRSYVLYYQKGSVFCRLNDNQLEFPRFEDLAEQEKIYETSRYLFSIDGVGYFLLSKQPTLRNEKFKMENISCFRLAEPLHQAFAGITGYQLYQWYGQNAYCGRCGKPMRHADNERMLFCPECKHTVYPKISPAVIVAVIDGERILMTKYKGREYTRYALIAGFNEIGETIEETVHREVMEEVGLKVKNLKYYKSQPWSFSDTLLMGFFCQLDGTDEIKLDLDELSLGEWIERKDIPETDPRISLTNEMICRFKNGER